MRHPSGPHTREREPLIFPAAVKGFHGPKAPLNVYSKGQGRPAAVSILTPGSVLLTNRTDRTECHS